MMYIQGLPVTKGLIGLYEPNNYNETTGTWTDSSGTGNHLEQATPSRRPTKNSAGSVVFTFANKTHVHRDSIGSLFSSGEFMIGFSGNYSKATTTNNESPVGAASSTHIQPLAFTYASHGSANGSIFRNTAGTTTTHTYNPGTSYTNVVYRTVFGRSSGNWITRIRNFNTGALASYTNAVTQSPIATNTFAIGVIRRIDDMTGVARYNGTAEIVTIHNVTLNSIEIMNIYEWLNYYHHTVRGV